MSAPGDVLADILAMYERLLPPRRTLICSPAREADVRRVVAELPRAERDRITVEPSPLCDDNTVLLMHTDAGLELP